ncbi:hypothetical protein CIPAW_05G070300 [Carya illinoinensis]|uniref:Uncharacterized protein n=1 Tax=Carya illinoinensis TaxID=32201 RepID=A0A8T1QFP3_CARIL|nr:hypothetical protein CIPAW_05G070300 [Carya illinoinensis]
MLSKQDFSIGRTLNSVPWTTLCAQDLIHHLTSFRGSIYWLKTSSFSPSNSHLSFVYLLIINKRACLQLLDISP